MGSLKENTINGVKWSAIERFTVQGVSFVVGLVLARLLTPSDFGIIGMLSIFMSISQTFIDSGFSNALIRKLDRTEVDCSTAFYFNIVVGALCFAILYAVSPIIASFYNQPILTEVTRVLAITLFINSLTVVQVAILTIKIDFKTQAVINLVSSIASGVLGIALAYWGFGVWSLVYQQVFRAFLSALLFWILTKWRPLLLFSWSSFKDLFSFGSKLLLSGLLHTFYMNFTNLVIGKFYSSKDLGYYERGRQFGAIPTEMSLSVIQRVVFPILSTIQNDDDRLISVYRKYIKIISIAIFFMMMLLVALSKPVIIILLTDKWAESIIYLQLYCFAQMFNHVTRINLNLLEVKGRSDLYLRLEIVKKTISFCMLLIAAPFGVIAICVSQILYAQIAIFINTYYTNKLFGLSYWMQVKDFSKYFIASMLACIPVYVMVEMGVNDYICVIIGPFIAFAIYAFVILPKDENFTELKNIALNAIKRH